MTDKEKALELSAFWALLAQNDNGFTFAGMVNDGYFSGPNMNSDIDDYSINPPKPVLQTIDLSVCIKSKIDMEFWTSDTLDKDYIAKLVGIKNGVFFSSLSNENKWLHHCRVRQDHWHSWMGGECPWMGECPLPEGLKVSLLFRDGTTSKGCNFDRSNEAWRHDGGMSDIIAFQVLGSAEGWIYEKDKDDV